MVGGREPGSLDVRKAIEAGRIPPVWLWAGPEEYLKDELFALLAAKVVGRDLAALNVLRYRAGEEALDVVLAACRTLPMLSPRRAVLLRDIEKLGKADREKLAGYAAAPTEETRLVLAGEAGTQDSFARRLAGAGAAAAMFWIPFENETCRWIQIRFRDLGKRCDTATAHALLALCGGGFEQKVPLREVAPEIEKVALAVGDGDTVTEDDLGVIGRRADQGLLYEISGRVAARDLAGALRALDGALLFKDNTEIRIVVNLTHLFLNAGRARTLFDAGMPPDRAVRELKIWRQGWPDVERAARSFPPPDLERSIRVLAAADRTLKSSPKPSRLVLEEALVAICG